MFRAESRQIEHDFLTSESGVKSATSRGPGLRDLQKITQCAIYGFGLLKWRKMATITNDLEPGATDQPMRPFGYADW